MWRLPFSNQVGSDRKRFVMSFFKVKHRHRLSVIIPNGANNGLFFFEDVPKLRNTETEEVITTGIKCFFRPQIDPGADEVPGPPVITQGAAIYCQFSLASGNEYRINNMPLTEIMNEQYSVMHQRIPDAFEPLMVDWSKSFVTIQGAPAGTIPGGGAKIVFGIDYLFQPRGTLAAYRQQIRTAQNLALSQF